MPIRDVLQLLVTLGFVASAGLSGAAIGPAYGWGFLALAFGLVLLLLASDDGAPPADGDGP